MLEADRAFAGMSEQKGIKQAYLEYIDSNGVLLRPGQVPLLGADAVDYLIQLNDSNYSLKWEPGGGAVAKSGEIGYTYGVYALKPSASDTILYGNYVNIWKKQADGKWKVVLTRVRQTWTIFPCSASSLFRPHRSEAQAEERWGFFVVTSCDPSNPAR